MSSQLPDHLPAITAPVFLGACARSIPSAPPQAVPVSPPADRAQSATSRGVSRSAYHALRRHQRDKGLTREERRLPPHPDGSGHAACPECRGAGSFTCNDSNPYGYGPDPQQDYDVTCDECGGEGIVPDGTPDPLAGLGRARLLRRLGGAYRWRYESLRRRALTRCSGLLQAEMLAMAARCTAEAERGVAAWRAAASPTPVSRYG